MKTTTLYNKNLQWHFISDKAIVILPSDELLNKYNLIPPMNRDTIIKGIESGILWWNDFGPCYTGKNSLCGMTMITQRMKETDIENIDYNKYNEKFIEECLCQFLTYKYGKVFGYVIVDFDVGTINKELVFIRCNKK
jgi:hypothetical protein